MLRNGGHPTSAPELSKIPLSPVLCLLLFAHRKLQVFGPQLRQKDSVKNIFPVVVIYFFFFSNKVHAKFCSPLSSHKCERTAGKMWFFDKKKKKKKKKKASRAVSRFRVSGCQWVNQQRQHDTSSYGGPWRKKKNRKKAHFGQLWTEKKKKKLKKKALLKLIPKQKCRVFSPMMCKNGNTSFHTQPTKHQMVKQCCISASEKHLLTCNKCLSFEKPWKFSGQKPLKSWLSRKKKCLWQSISFDMLSGR